MRRATSRGSTPRSAHGTANRSHLELFRRTVTDLRAFVLAQDIVYVGGGNTANMLAVWRVHGLDTILREAYESGVLLCGISAGACCWFESRLLRLLRPAGAARPTGWDCCRAASARTTTASRSAGPATWRPSTTVRCREAGRSTTAPPDCSRDGRLADVVTRKPGATLRRVGVGEDGSVAEVAQTARVLGPQV